MDTTRSLEPAEPTPVRGLPAPTAPALAQVGVTMAVGRALGQPETVQHEGPAIDLPVVDRAGYPLAGMPYRLSLPDGTDIEDVLADDGTIRRSVPAPGRITVVLPAVMAASWASSETRIGVPVEMRASTVGFDDGTLASFLVFRRQLRNADALVDTIPSEVKGNAVAATWMLDPSLGVTMHPPADDETAITTLGFYFELHVGPCLARSGALRIHDDLHIECLDPSGLPRPHAQYVVRLPDGSARRGRADHAGVAIERDVPPGYATVTILGR